MGCAGFPVEGVQVQAETGGGLLVKGGPFFARRVQLPPDALTQSATASWSSGLLTISIPRRALLQVYPPSLTVVQEKPALSLSPDPLLKQLYSQGNSYNRYGYSTVL